MEIIIIIATETPAVARLVLVSNDRQELQRSSANAGTQQHSAKTKRRRICLIQRAGTPLQNAWWYHALGFEYSVETRESRPVLYSFGR
jgi:hypothetical protein